MHDRVSQSALLFSCLAVPDLLSNIIYYSSIIKYFNSELLDQTELDKNAEFWSG